MCPIYLDCDNMNINSMGDNDLLQAYRSVTVGLISDKGWGSMNSYCLHSSLHTFLPGTGQ